MLDMIDCFLGVVFGVMFLAFIWLAATWLTSSRK